MTLVQLQDKLSVEKWTASEEAGYDLCGSYTYCSKCNKEEEFPCARALNRAKKTAKPATAKKLTTKKAVK